MDRGELADLAAVDNRFRVFEVHYDDYAYSWALRVLRRAAGPYADDRETTTPSPPGATPMPRCAARPMPTGTATARSTWPSATDSTATSEEESPPRTTIRGAK